MPSKQLTMFPTKPVKLKMSWEDMLGRKRDEFPDAIRRERWEQWKSLAEKSSADVLDWWAGESSREECANCKHRDGDWCSLQQLPCTVNPILTMKHGMIGMACMGAGFEIRS